MSITPNDPASFEPSYNPANYTQSMGTYNAPQTFRFWCQKILPLVYDDSLSYYELLCKVVDYLNKTMEDVNTAVQDVNDLNDSYNNLQQYTNDTFNEFKRVYDQLQNYVNSYFDTLDVQEEINNKLDDMVEDGTFDTLLAPYMRHYQDELDLMKSRITTLETNYNAGGTTADAELADIRVGYDGKIWSTAGDAVRGQVDELYDAIDDIAEWTIPVNLSKAPLVNGGITASDGTNRSSDSLKRTDYINVGEIEKIIYTRPYITANSAVWCCVAFYDASKNFIESEKPVMDQTEYQLILDIITVPTGAEYARFSINPTYGDLKVYDATQYLNSIKQHITDLDKVTEIDVVVRDMFTENSWAEGHLGSSAISPRQTESNSLYNEVPVKVYEGEVIALKLAMPTTETQAYFYYAWCDENGIYTQRYGNSSSYTRNDGTYRYYDTILRVPHDGYFIMSFRSYGIDYEYSSIKYRYPTSKIQSLESRIDNLEAVETYVTEVKNQEFNFIKGGWSRAGNLITGETANRYLVTGDYVQPNVIRAYTTSDDYKITVHAFEDNEHVGFRTAENVITSDSSAPSYMSDSVNFESLRKSYPDYDFRVQMTTTANAGGTNTDISLDAGKYVEFEEKVMFDSGIREYYINEMNKTISDVQNIINEPALVFPMVTDIHFMSTTNMSTLFNVGIDNIVHFTEKIPCDFVLNLGDNTDGNQTPTETIRRNKYMQTQFSRLLIPYYMAIGNHDTNYFDGSTKLTGKETFASYLSNTRGVVFDPAEYNLNFYKDFDNIGIRLVVLDADYMKAYGYNDDIGAWLTNVVLDTNNVVLLCEHLSSINTQNWSAQSLTNGSDVTSALTSFVNNGGTLIQLCGHSHTDYYFDTPWLTIFSGCQKFWVSNTSSEGFTRITGEIGEIVAPERTLKTATEDLWSVFVVKPLSGIISSIRFGAGSDRHFHYNAISVETTVTLTSILTGTLTWTTSDDSVATVSNGGVVSAQSTGKCQIIATDTNGNFEAWTIEV